MNICKDLICILTDKNLTISTMESCTGGALSNYITNIEHCSNSFIGGYVTYSNEQKIRCGGSKEIIDKYTVYSMECAEAMAEACIKNTGSSIGVGVTGTLGNIDKNNNSSKIGEVFISIIYRKKRNSYKVEIPSEILKHSRKFQKKYLVRNILNSVYNIVI